MIEKFTLPAASAIIEGSIKGKKAILIQTREKNPNEGTGYIEIPGGKIREFENIFDSLRREVKEETGLEITKIIGETSSSKSIDNDYFVIGYEPFYCA